MFITQIWFASIIACTGPADAPKCSDHLIGAFTDQASCIEAVASVATLTSALAAGQVGHINAECFSFTSEEA